MEVGAVEVVFERISILEVSKDDNVNGANISSTFFCRCCDERGEESSVRFLDASNSVRKLSNRGGSSGSARTKGVNGSGSPSSNP